jgi:uncharacterized protein YyaL (SSP411 family)
VVERLWDREGRIFHRYREGEAGIAGFLEDYAFLAWGFIELYEATFEQKYLRYAIDLSDRMIADFWDETQGGFFQTAEGSEAALVRNKEVHDGAYPSGNSVAALDLILLARMTGETRFEEKAEQLMHVFSAEVARAPHAHAQLMIALDFALGPSSEVVIVGDSQGEDTADMLRAIRSKFFPNNVILVRSSVEDADEIASLAKFTKDLKAKEGRATAFVCQNHVCKLPTTDPSAMLELLDEQQ